MTARQFGGNPYDPKARHQHWKTIAAAVVGAAAFNMAENKARAYYEKREAEQGQN